MNQSPGENPLEEELNRISQIVSRCRTIEDVISQLGKPSETISLPGPSNAVQYRFLGNWELVSLVVIDKGRGLEFLAEPIASS